MDSNITNTTTIATSTEGITSWSAVIFLIFVAVLFIISIVLILYFEKLCCFARYRCLKYLLRRINRTNKSKSALDSTSTIPSSPTRIKEETKFVFDSTPEFLWIAGHREPIETFQPSEETPIESDESGTDLPDDDYTTIVPPIQKPNGNSRKLPIIPTIVENKDKGGSTSDERSVKVTEKQRSAISDVAKRHSPTPNSVDRTQSAPSSPALLHTGAKRSPNSLRLRQKHDPETASIRSDRSSFSASGPTVGSLEVRLKFDAKNSKMWVFVVKATVDTPCNLSKQSLLQIHLTMLPSKRVRFRTRSKQVDNAMFAEEFFCKVSSESIETQGIRFRLYANERFKREKLLAQAIIMFGLVNLDEDMCKIISLERVTQSKSSEESDQSTSQSRSSISTFSKQEASNETGNLPSALLPELEIGLSYDKNQSILVLELGKGINFAMATAGRAPDTYAQLTLLNSSGQEIVSHRTVVRRNQNHPIFAERYPLNVQENLLDQITIIITVINKKPTGKGDRNIGWISFGHSASGNAQVAHWDSMLNGQGETITRWHALLES